MADLDVVGIGNALVDVLCQEGEDFLAAQGLIKGAMQLVDEPRARELYRRAIAKDPNYADAHVNLGRLLHEGGEVHAALAHVVDVHDRLSTRRIGQPRRPPDPQKLRTEAKNRLVCVRHGR